MPPEFGRSVGHDAVFGIETGFLSKAAADIADQHAHTFLRPLQHGLGQQIAGRARRLRLYMQDQPAGFLLDLGDGGARLHGGGNKPLADQIERDFVRSFCKCSIDRGRIAIAHRGDDVVGRFRPHRGCAGFCRSNGIDDRRQHFVFDRDRFRRRLRRDPRYRHHGHHRLAGKAHDLMRQQPPRRHRHRRPVGTLEHRQRREGADVIGDQVGAGVDSFDARHAGRGFGVDRHDFRMRMRRAQDIEPQRAVFGFVVDEQSLPGEKPLILEPLDRLARPKTHIAGKNIHQFVLRVFCPIGLGGF